MEEMETINDTLNHVGELIDAVENGEEYSYTNSNGETITEDFNVGTGTKEGTPRGTDLDSNKEEKLEQLLKEIFKDAK